jgi:hypothetical protein
MTEDEDYDALSQKHLASLKRDTRVSLEDATVRAAHKVVAKFKPNYESADYKEGFADGEYAAETAMGLKQASERNFCPRCGKRLMGPLGPVSIHTCCPPNGRTFDDYGNKIV